MTIEEDSWCRCGHHLIEHRKGSCKSCACKGFKTASQTGITEQDIEEYAELFPMLAITASIKGLMTKTGDTDERIIWRIKTILSTIRQEMKEKEEQQEGNT